MGFHTPPLGPPLGPGGLCIRVGVQQSEETLDTPTQVHSSAEGRGWLGLGHVLFQALLCWPLTTSSSPGWREGGREVAVYSRTVALVEKKRGLRNSPRSGSQRLHGLIMKICWNLSKDLSSFHEMIMGCLSFNLSYDRFCVLLCLLNHPPPPSLR